MPITSIFFFFLIISGVQTLFVSALNYAPCRSHTWLSAQERERSVTSPFGADMSARLSCASVTNRRYPLSVFPPYEHTPLMLGRRRGGWGREVDTKAGWWRRRRALHKEGWFLTAGSTVFCFCKLLSLLCSSWVFLLLFYFVNWVYVGTITMTEGVGKRWEF